MRKKEEIKQFTIRIPIDIYNELQKYAGRMRSVNSIASEIVVDHVEAAKNNKKYSRK